MLDINGAGWGRFLTGELWTRVEKVFVKRAEKSDVQKTVCRALQLWRHAQLGWIAHAKKR